MRCNRNVHQTNGRNLGICESESKWGKTFQLKNNIWVLNCAHARMCMCVCECVCECTLVHINMELGQLSFYSEQATLWTTRNLVSSSHTSDILPLPHSTQTLLYPSVPRAPDHEPHHSPLHWVPEQQSPEHNYTEYFSTEVLWYRPVFIITNWNYFYVGIFEKQIQFSDFVCAVCATHKFIT
jgi:hypothetical protein